MTNELTDVRCSCGDEYPADSYDAGFIAGSGICQNCDAALPPKDICTCPSGDGSLRHPCPAHPAAEQAGGDERKLSDLGNELHNLSCSIVHENEEWAEQIGGIARELWNWPQARAALAQPSPALELERPEVVAWRYGFSGGIVSDKACLDEWKSGGEYQSLMTVAQHERIVGALRAKTDQLREALEWRKENQAGQRELLRSVTAERDAALARVAELERGKVYVEARQCDECQHGGINDSATGVAACHECDWTGPEPEEDRCPGCQRENCMAAACPQCGARYVLVASEEIAAPVAQAQQLNDLDKQCRDDVARALGLRPNQERGFAWSYLLASIKSCVKASGDSAQAQHSVPIAHEFKRALGLVVAALEADGDRPTSKYALSELKKVLAAAPGTEVPQAWLDVQAERRRQITAEGWTPDHDDLYCAAELPRAAAAYILSGANDEAPAIWPFSAKWWKPRDARANYMRAGALILAEIERLDRAAERGKEVGHE